MHLRVRYGWTPERIRNAILNFADFYGSTREVSYPRRCVVVISSVGKGRYLVEETPLSRVASTRPAGYTSRVASSEDNSSQHREALMATRTAAKAPARRAKPKPAPVEEPEEELEDELDPDDVEDEADEELEDEDAEDAEDEEQEDEDDEEAPDYTGYADKAATATMVDFADWLLEEVFGGEFDGDEDDFREGVRLGGTLRMEFQKSDFNKERRAERQAAKAKPATKPRKAKAQVEEPEDDEDEEVEEAPAKPTRRTGAAAGRPAARPADRKPAAAKAAPAKAASTKAAPAKATGGRSTTRRKGAAPY